MGEYVHVDVVVARIDDNAPGVVLYANRAVVVEKRHAIIFLVRGLERLA